MRLIDDLSGRTRRTRVAGSRVLSSAILVALAVWIALPAGGVGAPQPLRLGRSESLRAVFGIVRINAPGSGRFVLLHGTVTVPDQSQVDATLGRVVVTVPTARAAGRSSALAYGGRFRLRQQRVAPYTATFTLTTPLAGCAAQQAAGSRGTAAAATASGRTRPSAAQPPASSARRAARVDRRQLVVQEEGGSWGTAGRFAVTTARGARWLTRDVCTSTLVRVAQGSVQVRNLIRATSRTLHAGQQSAAALTIATQAREILRQCVSTGRVSVTYARRAYKFALRHLPADVREYTDCQVLIRRAQKVVRT